MKITDQYVLFWRGPFSNWVPSHFKWHDIEFLCGEQYMMYRKATLFGDTYMADKILQTATPRDQKALGRTVANFDDKLWMKICIPMMVEGLYEKFKQNPGFGNDLLRTERRVIAEASPVDFIWGIGLAEDDPLALDPRQWKGNNFLGTTLMLVRSMLSTDQVYPKIITW